MDGIWVVLSTDAGGELNREFVPHKASGDEDDIQAELQTAVRALLSDGIRAGDRIEFFAGWSEA